MIRTRWSFLSVLLVLIFVVTACGGAAEAPAAEEDAPAAEEDAPAADAGSEAAAGSLPGEGVAVTMGRATWDTGWFQAAIYATLLEELGYDVQEPQTLDNQVFYLSASRGEVDFWVNSWLPNHDIYVNNEDFAGTIEVVGNQLASGALQGYLIDKATADELGITSLADFAKPDVAARFDTDDDGRADLTGCNPGWACEQIINFHIEEYGLADSVTQVQGEYSALMADTIARFERNEPIFFYTWTPNWTIAELVPGEDVVWVTVPYSALPEDLGAGQDTVAEGVEGCAGDPCEMGFPPNDIRVTANSEFLANNPAAARLLEVVSIPLQDIAAQNVLMTIEGENTEADIERHAAEWLEANRDLADSWLAEARTAAN